MRSAFFRGIFLPDVLVAYRHSHNKSTEKGEAVLDVGGLTLRMLSGGDSDRDRVGGPNALRVPLYREVWSSKSVTKSSPRVPHTPRESARPRLRETQRDEKGIALTISSIYSMDGKLSLIMYVVIYRHSHNKRCGEGREGGHWTWSGFER